jgi:glycosyltransferase involved in cell wall biosynthesis
MSRATERFQKGCLISGCGVTMEIVLINHYAGSLTYGMEYRPYYLAREWVALGHHVTVVGATFSHLRMRSPKSDAGISYEVIDGIRYVWLKTPKYKGNGILRVINMLTFVARLFLYRSRLQGSEKVDAVIASSTYPLDMFAARTIARKNHAFLVFEVHDLWPLSPMELGKMSRWHPFIMVMKWGENFAFRNADAVVSLLANALGHMIEHGLAPEKFFHIPNGIVVSEWQGDKPELPAEQAQKLDQLKASGRFLVGYFGAHGKANALDSLVLAARYLAADPVTILLVGQGPEKDALVTMGRELGLNNVVFLNPVPKAAVPSLLGRMDCLYLGLQNKPLFRFGVSPNKLFDYMMAGKPVVQAIQAGSDIVSSSGCGFTVSPEDPQALADEIRRLMRMSGDERSAMGARGKEYMLKYHDYRVLAKDFLRILQNH